MAVRTLTGTSPVTDSMVITSPVDASNYTTERLGELGSRRAQPFFATQAYLSKVTFRKGTQTGTFAGTVKISIQSGTANNPSGTDLVSYTYTAAQWIALATDTDITLTLRTPMTIGGIYFIVFTTSTVDASNYSRLYANRNTANQNAAGVSLTYNGTWATNVAALYFKITSGPAYYSEVARTTVTRTAITQPRVATRDMGTALSFDGVSNFVEIPAIASLSGGGTRTVASWIFYAGLINDNEGIFGMGANSNGNMFYLRTASANNRFQMTTFGTDAYSANGSLIKNKWNHVVGVISSTDIRLYVNGVLSGTPVTLNHTLNVTSSVARIGRRFNSTEYLKGKIDNTRVYNIALTATEVANMYFSNIVPINGLVAEYLFNETTGTTALDSSGNGNNGTITGATYTTDVPLKERTLI